MMAVAARKGRLDVKALLNFFQVRKKPNGGFGAIPRLPATIEDTYYSLRSLKLLERAGCYQVPNDFFTGHHQFLSDKLKEGWAGTRRLFHLLRLLKDADGDKLFVKADGLIRKNLSKNPDLEQAFYVFRIGMEIGQDEKIFQNLSFREYSVRTVRDLRMFLYLKRGQINRVQREKWKDWVIACQNGDGGFGFMPGTTAYMENCYYALRCLEILNCKPSSPDSLVAFILSSKGKSGGFGRKNLGVPFTSSTWHALASLFLVEFNL